MSEIKLADGCRSASSPCIHQKVSPYTICDTCRGILPEAVRQERERCAAIELDKARDAERERCALICSEYARDHSTTRKGEGASVCANLIRQS